jgi:signal transduction histidine kinase
MSTGNPNTEGRRGIFFAAAGVALLFSISDFAILDHFSWSPLIVRLLWASGLAGVALALGRVDERTEHLLMLGAAVLTGACFPALVTLTGGTQSPMFHWILAVPLTVAVVVQEFPSATTASSVVTIFSGLWLLHSSGKPSSALWEWGIQAAGMSALAIYGSLTYRKLHARQTALMLERQEALERALMMESERRARERAEHEVRQRDEFLTIASHELKTPLTTLKLQVQAVLRAARLDPNSPPPNERLNLVERQVERLVGFIDTLLDVSRIRMNRLTLVREEVDLVALIREVVERLGADISQSHCTLALDLPAQLVGRWDRVRLEQVLMNLLSNAMKYGPDHPIEVHLQGTPTECVLVIRDQGIGIAPEDQQRIFGRFERGVSSRQYGGLGLGLWIVDQVVGALGGTINVDSQLGQGTAFTLKLPRDSPESPSQSGASGDTRNTDQIH